MTLPFTSNMQRGFTLIELMVVLAIIGILSSLAYSSYETQVKKTRRTSANKTLLECSAILERQYTVNSTYSTAACNNLQNKYFAINVVVDGLNRLGKTCDSSNGRKNCFRITASPKDPYVDAQCAQIIVNEIGVKRATGSGGDASAICWLGSS